MHSQHAKKPHPAILPRIAVGDKVVGIILTDLENIKKTKGIRQLEKSQYLVHYIAQQLRKADKKQDNLLQTTAIWALINLFRMHPEDIRGMMLQAGIPGVLLDVIRAGIGGVSRQYASELCFFLSSNTQYPDLKGDTSMKPLSQFPEIKVGNDIAGELPGNTGILGQPNVTKVIEAMPFTPYRINEANMSKLSAIFTKSAPIIQGIGDSIEDGNEENGSFGDDYSVGDRSANSSDMSMLSNGSRSTTDMLSYRLLTKGLGMNGNDGSLTSSAINQPKKKKKSSMQGQLAARIRTITQQNERLAANASSFSRWNLHDDHKSPRLEAPFGTKGTIAVTPLKSQSAKSQLDDILGGGFSFASGGDDDDDDAKAIEEDTVTVSTAAVSIAGASLHSEAPANISRALLQGSAFRNGGLGFAEPIGMKSDARNTNSSRSSRKRTEPLHYKTNTRRPRSQGSQPFASSSAVDSMIATMDPLSLESTMVGGLHAATDSLMLADMEDEQEEQQIPVDKPKGKSSRGHTVTYQDQIIEAENEDDEENDEEQEYGEDEQDADEDNDLVQSRTATSSPSKRAMRIKAEQLIDLRFIRRLFSTKISLKESQSFINRLSDMLSLLDKEGTGFVTWYCFTKTILALAPAKLLRSDVEEFMRAQTDDPEDTIDYEEFIISGKVMIIRKYGTKESTLPVSAWLERQKLYAGDESTHTWKKHVEWYRTRKAEAVVWLMRRATKAMTKWRFIEDNKKYLTLLGSQAKAFTFLKETGFCAIRGEINRMEAKRRLLARCLHAKRFVDIKNEAKRYLYHTARGIVALIRENPDEEQIAIPPRKPQADFANIYRLDHLRKTTQAWLATRAKRSVKHWIKTVDTMEQLLLDGKKAIQVMVVQEDTRIAIRLRADRARAYCTFKDTVALWLLRMGRRAYDFLAGQENAIKWLQARGQRALKFSNKKIMHCEEYLKKLGDFHLVRMNDRSVASHYLIRRKQLAISLLERQQLAIEYLQRIPVSAHEAEAVIKFDHSWLVNRGRRALDHQLNQFRALRKLQFIAGKASNVQRKMAASALQLQQIGRLAVFQAFEKQWVGLPGNKERLANEKARLVTLDQRTGEQRKSLKLVERWEAEFTDAVRFAIRMACTPGQELKGDDANEITVSGILRVTLRGKLLNVSKEYIMEGFRHADYVGSGILSDHDAVVWLLEEAKKRHRRMMKEKPNGKGFFFVVNDIFSIQDRALILLLRRYWSKSAKTHADHEGVEDDAMYGGMSSSKQPKSSFYQRDYEDDGEDEEEEEAEKEDD